VREVPIPEIGDEDVLIRVIVCGVCASELPKWMNGFGDGNYILGHEPVGYIESCGKNVKGFQIGDRVTCITPHAFAEYVKVDYRNIVNVPENLDDKEALGDPVSCLVSGANRTDVQLGDTVAVIGAGFMGLGFMQLMRLKGAARIIAVDVNKNSLQNALRFGADIALLPSEVDDCYKISETGKYEGGVNVAVEASGSASGLTLAGEMTGVHGILSIVGYHQNGMREINMKLWNWKAISVVNAHERRNDVYNKCMKSGLSLIASGLLNMKDMITDELCMDEVNKTFDFFINRPENSIKSIIRIRR
jgi:threonine dehydrogenase-like Zn-dependent dehydrogenase